MEIVFIQADRSIWQNSSSLSLFNRKKVSSKGLQQRKSRLQT